jgi:hypothetical protein
MSEKLTDKINSLKKKELLTDKGKLKRPEKKTPAYDDGKYLGNLSGQEIRDYQNEQSEKVGKKVRQPRTKFKASGGRIHLKGGGICKKGINKKAFGKNS